LLPLISSTLELMATIFTARVHDVNDATEPRSRVCKACNMFSNCSELMLSPNPLPKTKSSKEWREFVENNDKVVERIDVHTEELLGVMKNGDRNLSKEMMSTCYCNDGCGVEHNNLSNQDVQENFTKNCLQICKGISRRGSLGQALF
jgi:hypothetical protein